MNAISFAGKIGPVRRVSASRYRATCPSCMTAGALTIRLSTFGERVACHNCPAADVIDGLRQLEAARA